jgi:hypothetical protein
MYEQYTHAVYTIKPDVGYNNENKAFYGIEMVFYCVIVYLLLSCVCPHCICYLSEYQHQENEELSRESDDEESNYNSDNEDVLLIIPATTIVSENENKVNEELNIPLRIIEDKPPQYENIYNDSIDTNVLSTSYEVIKS